MLQKLPARTLGLDYVAIQVADLDRAVSFYTQVLGLKRSSGNALLPYGTGVAFEAPNGQGLVLVQEALRNDPTVSAAHCAYRVSEAGREAILSALVAKGVDTHRYREDRASEAGDNFYFSDPSGNRIQLVTRSDLYGDGVQGIDHAAIEVNDILWSEKLFGDWLGWEIEHRVGWNTQDYISAKKRGEQGMRDAMPGSRYWNERYSQFETERKSLRPNPQLYFSTGGGTSVAVYLASRNYTASPDADHVGAPRLCIRVRQGGLAEIAQTFTANKVPFVGPVAHPRQSANAASLYLREPGGNFLEFFETR